MVNISVIVPTFRRPEDLWRCLHGLDLQQAAPYEVIVVCRDTDEETRPLVREWLQSPGGYRKRLIHVSAPGVVIAMQAGTAAAAGEVVAYTDDDAVPRPDWLKRMSVYYRDYRIGGVGGRDFQEGVPEPSGPVPVGKITWYGRLVGNHHAGTGAAKEADVLKGVNMSFRKPLVVFPEGLRGSGAQVHFEVHLCLRIRKLGYRLMYDPAIAVDHYPAKRFDEDQRNRIVPGAAGNAAYNLNLAVLNWGGSFRAAARILYSLAAGDRAAPGAVRLLIALARREHDVLQSFLPAQRALWESIRTRLRQGVPRSRRQNARKAVKAR
jgi:GT2 family glycosyltransferase